MQISVKNKTWTDISVKVDPNDNTWNAKANIQVKSDAQEDINLEEESFIFNCKQLNDSCTVTTYNIQNEPTIQSLELSDIVRAILQVFYGTLQKPSAVGSTDTSEISKSKEAEIYQSNYNIQEPTLHKLLHLRNKTDITCSSLKIWYNVFIHTNRYIPEVKSQLI
uniref:Ubiquitin-like domain-containing protein n=1 Tax=Chelydra serpentina TaxID=8475 RepID=A0A8C3TCP6_CHESE